jgi:hypothetical protein
LVALAWSAAVAVAILVAGTEINVIFPRHETATWVDQGRTSAGTTATPQKAQPSETITGGSNAELAESSGRRKGSERHVVKVPRTAATGTEDTASLPAGFTGLMYCDELSCGGEMQVVRMELPMLSASIGSGYAGSNGLVLADVLVGPDGVARGIRIVR